MRPITEKLRYILLLAHPIKRLELYYITQLELEEEVEVKGLYKVTFSFSLIWDKSIIPTTCRKWLCKDSISFHHEDKITSSYNTSSRNNIDILAILRLSLVTKENPLQEPSTVTHNASSDEYIILGWFFFKKRIYTDFCFFLCFSDKNR